MVCHVDAVACAQEEGGKRPLTAPLNGGAAAKKIRTGGQ
jgi:hypothetical protein